jgi:Prealbumin-like fold domain
MLGWTAHFASAVNWGAGEGASSISGSPFHMTLVGVDNGDGTSGGNRDRSAKLEGDLGGTIVIKKLTDPTSDTTAVFGFTGTGGITPTSFNLKNGGMETFVNVAPGTYTVTESTVPAGWALTNLVCVDPTGNSTTNLATSKATIDVASGETITCTFTNTQAGTLTVTKVTIPNDTTTGFPITASGTGTISGGPNQTVKTGAPVSYTVTPGTYAVSETPPAGWNQTGNTCTTVTVTAGQTASCTITNTQVLTGPPQLIVIKHVINNNGGTKTAANFTITVNGTAVPGGTTSFPGAEAPGTTLPVSAGTYTVAETVLTGYVPTFSGDCINATIANGQTKTCTSRTGTFAGLPRRSARSRRSPRCSARPAASRTTRESTTS